MRDRFALQQPPVDLVDLAKRMIHKVLHGIDIPCLRPGRLEFPPQPFRPRHQRPAKPQVGAYAVRMPPLPPGIADLVEQPLHLPPQMPALPPAAKPEGRSQLCGRSETSCCALQVRDLPTQFSVWRRRYIRQACGVTW